MGVLNRLAASMADTAPLGPKEEHLLALAQGWAHGTTHLFFFYYRRAALMHLLILCQ